MRTYKPVPRPIAVIPDDDLLAAWYLKYGRFGKGRISFHFPGADRGFLAAVRAGLVAAGLRCRRRADYGTIALDAAATAALWERLAPWRGRMASRQYADHDLTPGRIAYRRRWFAERQRRRRRAAKLARRQTGPIHDLIFAALEAPPGAAP